MTPQDLKSAAFKQAVARIQKRADKISDQARLAEIFVPSDVRTRVETTDTQLILGRRGTGKTHLIRAFQEDSQRHGDLVLFNDCTRLGSGYSGLDIEPRAIAAKYFISLLNQIGTDLHDASMRMELPSIRAQTGIMRQLVDSLVPLMSQRSAGSIGSLFNYQQIARTLENVLRDLGINRVFVVLDEWAQVHRLAQSHLAEFLKRAISIVPQISLKLLAVNYQCKFSERDGETLIGLQRGADIPDVVDLDEYLIVAEGTESANNYFGQILYNHLGIELGWQMERAIEEKVRVVEGLFTQRDTFTELVRAAEGNARDFLCVFGKAYFDEYCQSTASNLISKPNIVTAATLWFDAEKLANIRSEPDIVSALLYIMDHVLKSYKSRTFMVEESKSDHHRLIRLLNERILHKLSGTYSTKDRPGVRYDLFTVDYGAFARLRGTANEVDENIFLPPDGGKFDDASVIVPLDDKRSIRRIIFDPDQVRISNYDPYRIEGPIDLPLWRASKT